MFEHPALVEHFPDQHLRDLRHAAELARRCQAPTQPRLAHNLGRLAALRRLTQLGRPARRPAHA